ncbi:MAG TPA: hypothetical protein VLE93_03340 [Candidatus Saccharimonadales bacterium]|nr:hypothetical protein [Candidatus Saccharimonadales bacterium]
MTNQNILALGSTAQDLKRVATFIARGSNDNAKRFLDEAKKNAQQANSGYLRFYLINRLKEVSELEYIPGSDELAERALTIGVILQNAVLANS